MIGIEPIAFQQPPGALTCQDRLLEIANKVKAFICSIWGGVFLLTGIAAMIFGLKGALFTGTILSLAAFAIQTVRQTPVEALPNPVEFDDERWEFDYFNAGNVGMREMNAELFQNTLQVIERGAVNRFGERIQIDRDVHAAMIAGVRPVAGMPVGLARELRPQAPLADWLEVHNASTYSTLCRMVRQGYNPLVLDMANAYVKGGGVLNGALAQEETLCRQSNLYRGLEEAERRGGYPIPVHGGILVPRVQFFRDDPQQAYRFKEPITADVFVSAAFNSNRNHGRGFDRPADELVYQASMKEKMRTMFRMAVVNGNDSLLLSAFGCGAFRNQPNVVAGLYREVLQEPEFARAFRKVVFGIYDPPGAEHPNAPVFRDILLA